jgi:hypothetical protein
MVSLLMINRAFQKPTLASFACDRASERGRYAFGVLSKGLYMVSIRQSAQTT